MAKLPNNFLSKFIVKDNGCWEWIGAKFAQGYGSYLKNTKAHRFAYETLIGPINNKLVLDHLCRNRACVNPIHLEQVTNKENILRGTGASARNYIKTHCPKGHILDYIRKDRRGRGCLTCRREQSSEYNNKIKMRKINV